MLLEKSPRIDSHGTDNATHSTDSREIDLLERVNRSSQTFPPKRSLSWIFGMVSFVPCRDRDTNVGSAGFRVIQRPLPGFLAGPAALSFSNCAFWISSLVTLAFGLELKSSGSEQPYKLSSPTSRPAPSSHRMMSLVLSS
jgi:hypothetical protein